MRRASSVRESAIADSNTAANMQQHCAASYGQALQLAEIQDSSCETWVAELDRRLVAYVQLRFDAAEPLIAGERAVELCTMGLGWLINSWRTFLRGLMPPDMRCYGLECGNEMQEPWPSIENGDLKLWGSISSWWVTTLNVTC